MTEEATTSNSGQWSQTALRGGELRNRFRSVIVQEGGDMPRLDERSTAMLEHLQPDLRALMHEIALQFPDQDEIVVRISADALCTRGVGIVVENIELLDSSDTDDPVIFKAIIRAVETTAFAWMEFTGIVGMPLIEFPLRAPSGPRVPLASSIPLPFRHRLNGVDLWKRMDRPGDPSGIDLPKVEIELTNFCNNRCAFCTSGWLNLERAEVPLLTRDEANERMRQGLAQGGRRALFQGGEPTLHTELGDLVSDAYAMGYEAVNVFTNARIAASDKGLDWLLGMNVTWWQVSVQGGDADLHDRSVVRRGAFRQTVRGLERLIGAGERVKINGVLTVHLLQSLAGFADLMIRLRPEEVGLDTVKPLGAFGEERACYADLVPSYREYAGAIRDAVLRMNRAGVRARLTNFAPCLVPGVEPFLSDEHESTINYSFERDESFVKSDWKAGMKVKTEGCRACIYDEVCGGVYDAYLDAHGAGELRAVLEASDVDPMSMELRRMFVHPDAGAYATRSVTTTEWGWEMHCVTPSGPIDVQLRVRDGNRAYAQTQLFALSYRADDPQAAQLRMLDALALALDRATDRLAPVLGVNPESLPARERT